MRLLAAYNYGEVEPSEFYTTDCLLVPPRGDAVIGYESMDM